MKHEDYYRFLEILISKHNEQSSSYYKRLTLYFTIITVLIVGLSTIANTKDVQNETLRKISLIGISFLGLTFSIIWTFILRASNRWLQYWRWKIYLFEHENIDLIENNVSNMFMLDRYDNLQPSSNENIAFKDYSESREKALKYRPKIHGLIKIFIITMIFAFGAILTAIFIY